MSMIKPFMAGNGQTIRIPKEYRHPDEDVFINRIGNTVTLTPKSKLVESFENGLKMFTDDYMADGRREEIESQRIDL